MKFKKLWSAARNRVVEEDSEGSRGDDTGIRLDGLRNTTKTISQDNRSLD
jgi:hypothetical protein